MVVSKFYVQQLNKFSLTISFVWHSRISGPNWDQKHMKKCIFLHILVHFDQSMHDHGGDTPYKNDWQSNTSIGTEVNGFRHWNKVRIFFLQLFLSETIFGGKLGYLGLRIVSEPSQQSSWRILWVWHLITSAYGTPPSLNWIHIFTARNQNMVYFLNYHSKWRFLEGILFL